jgi:hypothetical protein
LESKSNNGTLDSEEIQYTFEYPEVQGLRDQGAQRRINNSIEATMADTLKTTAATNGQDINPTGSTLTVEYQPKLLTKSILSLYFLNVRESRLSAHPAVDVITLNFDLRAGTRLTVADLFRPDTPFIDVIAHETLLRLQDMFQEVNIQTEVDENDLAVNSANFNQFTLTKDSFVVEFGACAISPCAAGPLSVPTAYRVLEDIIDPKGPLKNASKTGLN